MFINFVLVTSEFGCRIEAKYSVDQKNERDLTSTEFSSDCPTQGCPARHSSHKWMIVGLGSRGNRQEPPVRIVDLAEDMPRSSFFITPTTIGSQLGVQKGRMCKTPLLRVRNGSQSIELSKSCNSLLPDGSPLNDSLLASNCLFWRPLRRLYSLAYLYWDYCRQIWSCLIYGALLFWALTMT